jgi:uncharacterized protein involved in type VI secretion and phage assembly
MREVGQINGVAMGLVKDRDGQGRVRVEFPWLDDTLLSDWIPVAAPMAGAGRGLFLMPESGDEVLVAFEHGRFEHPVVIGYMWNGADKPPTSEPRERMFASRNGHKIRFLDSTPTGGDQGAVIIEDAHGNKITLSNGQIAISAIVVVQINAPTVLINGRPVLTVSPPI